MTLTPNQARLLRFIEGYIKSNHGAAPSLEEMKEALGLSAKSRAFYLLEQLEQRGYVRRERYLARAITVLKPQSGALSDFTTEELKNELLRREIAA